MNSPKLHLVSALSLFFLTLTFFFSSHLAGDQPNIVLINLDDADSELLNSRMLDLYYPNIKSLADQGIRFTNLHATTPFCAPSRASLMTGQYAFNSGVKLNDPTSRGNNGFTGGYREFIRRGHHQNELGVWMKSAGYRTMHVGKYHHHNFDFQVPPGWDDFYISLGARYFGSYRFSNEHSEQGRGFHTGPNEYVTDVDAADADMLIRSHALVGSNQPMFLYIAPLAPHHPSSPDPEDMVHPNYWEFAPGESIQRDPDWNEADVSDKPSHLRLPVLAEYHLEKLELEYISRVRAIKSVDDLLGKVLTALTETNQRSDTFIFLTSDNGYQLGHHRLRNKMDPYQRTSSVPLLVTGPGVAENQSANHLLAHIDICPTILELAGATIPLSVDGKSFEPLLTNPEMFPEWDWQDSIMIENWADKPSFGRFLPASYVALRFYESVHVCWATGAREYYELDVDPFQLHNIYYDLPFPIRHALQTQIKSFRSVQKPPEITLIQENAPEVFGDTISLRGMIEDDAGVERIGVAIKSLSTGLFYDGESWSPGWKQFFIDPVAPGSLISQWYLHQQIELPPGNSFDFLGVTVRPYDDTGDYPLQVAWSVLPVDNVAPFAWIAPEIRGKEFGENVEVEGTFNENFYIDQVRVVIRDNANHVYWNGSGWTSEWTYLTAEVDRSGDWCLKTTMPSGRFSVSARAVDMAGNWQSEPSVSWFRVGP